MDLTDSNTKIFILPQKDLRTKSCWALADLVECIEVYYQPQKLRLQ
jgi:hypothetical protein